MRIARNTQRPGQTKEQTKLIAQGIQRGIDLYKKQHKAKARELDRRLRRAHHGESVTPPDTNPDTDSDSHDEPDTNHNSSRLPWTLLIATWLGITIFFLLPKISALLGN